jgi:hypothetical protein
VDGKWRKVDGSTQARLVEEDLRGVLPDLTHVLRKRVKEWVSRRKDGWDRDDDDGVKMNMTT